MNDAKEEIRSKLAIEDVIGEYVSLRRAGRFWRGLSPFTNERTPSFYVTPERDIWHDFSSGQGGDIFSFIELVEGVDFRGALEILAKKAGVDLGKYNSRAPKDLAQRKERIFAMNNLALNYFQHNMTRDQTALKYIFTKRHLTKQTVMEWGIGYAPSASRLKNLLLNKKFTEAEIRDAGLTGGHGGEMFRSRMMIPLRDHIGQIVGFTGRVIDDGEPKYLNTPGTILYDKGRQVFGLNFAKQSIRAADFSILVEGNLDVISSNQAGIKNIVACAGTALTKYHLKSLQRLSRNIRLCFDGDRAGIAATERAINLSQDFEVKLEVIDWSGADFGALAAAEKQTFDGKIPKDPDEITTRFGGQVWSRIVREKHQPAVDWVIEKYVTNNDIATADGQKIVSDKSLALIKNLRDKVEQEFYIKKVAQILGTSMRALMDKMNGRTTDAQTVRHFLRPSKTKINSQIARRNEEFYLSQIFALAYKYPRLAPILQHLPDTYLTADWAKIKYFLYGRKVKSTENHAEITSKMADKLAELELVAAKNFDKNTDERVSLMVNLNDLEKLKTRAKFESMSTELANVLESDDSGKAHLINGAVNALRQQLVDLEKSGARNDFSGLHAIWDERKTN
ncbi:MAG: DNA primase [Candidatus Nanoperiomorbaceae bacterium]